MYTLRKHAYSGTASFMCIITSSLHAAVPSAPSNTLCPAVDVNQQLCSLLLLPSIFYWRISNVLLPSDAAGAAAPAVAPAAAPAPAGPPPPVFHPMPPMSTPQPAAKPAKPATRVCSFFNKKKGCQTGALCPFLHQGVEGGGFGGTRGRAKTPPAPVVVAAPVAPSPVAAVAPSTPAAPKAKKPKSTPPPAAGLAAVAPAPPVPATTPALPFAAPPPSPAAAAAVSESPSSRRTRKRGRSETPVATGGGLLDGLPISPFVAPGAAAAAAASKEEPVVAAVPAGIPHPKADVWQVRERLGLVGSSKFWGLLPGCTFRDPGSIARGRTPSEVLNEKVRYARMVVLCTCVPVARLQESFSVCVMQR